MKRCIGPILAALMTTLPAPAFAQETSNQPGPAMTAPVDEVLARPAGYTLVWSDEFDAPGLPDPAKWGHDTHANKGGWYNNELQYYSGPRRENARVENGRLIIEARKERRASEPDYGGQEYSSTRLITRGKGEWTYGFYEIRAKLPCGKGIWPAIWTLGTTGGTWPANGEIDIMEHVGWDPGRVHGNIHTKAYNHTIQTQKGAWTVVPTSCTAFHDYQLLWTKDRILIGVDGKGYMAFDNDGKGNKDAWPFDAPHYLLLNIAVGGWGGVQGVDPVAFPAKMEVEYVRVWQPK
jgi:beta-glucanase (GH16 family)